MVEPAACWRAMVARGFSNLSPPEVEHAMLELATSRAEYVGLLQDLGDYPRRSPIGHRVPGEAEVATLTRLAGPWPAVTLLADERALRTAAGVFSRVFVLDPLYDTGAELYAAWHDPSISETQARHLANQAACLVRAGTLLDTGTAVLAPDHLPGSWNPRPGWREPHASEDQRELAAWSMRTALVLLYWADRLDAVVCTSRSDVIAALQVALGPGSRTATVELPEPERIDAVQQARERAARVMAEAWADLGALRQRRARSWLADVTFAVSRLGRRLDVQGHARSWRLAAGEPWLPEPRLLIQRVLRGQEPEREPPLPRRTIRRPPLCLVSPPESI